MSERTEWRVKWTAGEASVAKNCADEQEARTRAEHPYRNMERWDVRVESRRVIERTTKWRASGLLGKERTE